jgi:hypothetical protein
MGMKDIFNKASADDFLKTFEDKDEDDKEPYPERVKKMKGSEIGNEYYKLKGMIEKATGAKKKALEDRVKELLRVKKDAKF